MGLVDYSDSDTSEHEVSSTTKSKPPPKSGFTKVVDRANPNKIKVQLPRPASDVVADHDAAEEEQPPTKRQRTGVGAFAEFNSFLPAPKRSGQTSGTSAKSASDASSRPRVSLKTAAEPAFQRDVAAASVEAGGTGNDGANVDDAADWEKKTEQNEPAWTEERATNPPVTDGVTQPLMQRSARMFKPLSVARSQQKKKKKNKVTPVGGQALASEIDAHNPGPGPSTQKAAPRVSLFSLGLGSNERVQTSQEQGEYTPMIYNASTSEATATSHDEADPSFVTERLPEHGGNPSTVSEPGPLTLDTIADDLNLSKAARRQLLGRQGAKSESSAAAIRVLNFNTDREYDDNEALRAAGEKAAQQQHNPVRAIAPGKHNLKQLVNAAQSQREALEEHFAAGRRNKKEAGSRYGW